MSSQHVSLSNRRGRLGNFKESVFPLEVFHLHYAQNPELKTWEFSLGHIDQTRRFSNCWFSISHYTQNRKLGVKNLRHIDQIPRFSILHFSQNGKRRVENFGIFSEVYPDNDFVHFPPGGGNSFPNSFLRPPNDQTSFFNNQLSSFDTKKMAWTMTYQKYQTPNNLGCPKFQTIDSTFETSKFQTPNNFTPLPNCRPQISTLAPPF